jgi:hypothetical protein
MDQNEEHMVLGWREWIALPGLGLHAIKAKVDTGARTSALHAFNIEHYKKNDVEMVRFLIHPIQKNETFQIQCEAPLKDQRYVTDSGGHKEMRDVIETEIIIASHSYLIDLTLTDRDTMRFRMLLGRNAMKNCALVDPNKSYINGKIDAMSQYNLKFEVTK